MILRLVVILPVGLLRFIGWSRIIYILKSWSPVSPGRRGTFYSLTLALRAALNKTGVVSASLRLFAAKKAPQKKCAYTIAPPGFTALGPGRPLCHFAAFTLSQLLTAAAELAHKQHGLRQSSRTTPLAICDARRC